MARLPTKGTLLLHSRGVTVHQVAAVLGTASSNLSHWLGGNRPAPDRFYTAVTLLTDQEFACDLRNALEVKP